MRLWLHKTRRFIQTHPLAVVIPSYVAVIAVTVGATQFVYQKEMKLSSDKQSVEISKLQLEHDQEIQMLKAKLDKSKRRISSIQRHIGPDARFSADSFTIKRDNVTSLAGEDLVPIPELNCYVLDSDNTDWKYSATNMLEVVRTTGVNVDAMPEDMKREARALPAYLWTVNVPYRIESEYYNATISPYIVIRPIPHELLLGRFKAFLNPPTTTTGDRPSDDASWLERLYRGDSVGAYLTQFLHELMSQNSRIKNSRTKLMSIQMAYNVLYLNVLTRFDDVRVNGSDEMRFFISSELFVVSTADKLYVIEIVHPSADERFNDSFSSLVNIWLGHFHVVVD